MKKIVLIIAFSISIFASDMTIKYSDYSVKRTVENIKSIAKKKGFKIFSVIDHKKNAKSVAMPLNDAIVITFGNPKVATAMMQEDMTMALDLPLRVLVFKDKDGKVKLAYRDGRWMMGRHSLKNNKLLMKINKGMNMITNKARLKKK